MAKPTGLKTNIAARTGLILVLWLLLSGSGLSAQPAYSLGVVPQFDQRRLHDAWTPILEAVEAESGVRLELAGSPDIPAFEDGFSTGRFDFAYMNPYHMLVAHDVEGYLPLARDVGRQLYGIIVVKKDSPLQSVADLAGKRVAFPAPNALGAALIPRAEFARQFKIEIEPRYVRSHSSVYLNVAMGLTDAGGGVQKTLEQQKPELRDKLRVLYQTAKVAPHPIAVHPRVPQADRGKVLNALLKLGETPAGQRLLQAVPMKRIGAATLEDYQPLREMGLADFYVE